MREFQLPGVFFHANGSNILEMLFKLTWRVGFGSRLIKHMRALKNGESVEVPMYDFATHRRTDTTETKAPAAIVLVEGILIYTSEECVAARGSFICCICLPACTHWSHLPPRGHASTSPHRYLRVLIMRGVMLRVGMSHRLRDLLDVKLFIDTDADVRFIRR